MALVVSPDARLDAAERLAALDAADPADLLRPVAELLLDGTCATRVTVELQDGPRVEVGRPGAGGRGAVRRTLAAGGAHLGTLTAVPPRGGFEREDRVLLDTAARLLAEVVARHRVLERSLAEREGLRAERSRLDALLRTLPVGVFVVDAEGWLVQTNDAAVALWGETPAVGPEAYQRYQGWWPGGRRVESVDYAIARARVERRQVVLDADVETFRGDRRRMRSIAAPVVDRDGGLLGAVAVNVDLTDLAETGRARTEAIDRLEAVVRHLPAGLVVAAADGRIVVANELARLGRPGLTAGTSTIEDLRSATLEGADGATVPFEDLPLVRALRHGETTRGREVRVQLQDGSHRELSIDGGPVRGPDGTIHSAIIVCSDVTGTVRAARRAELLAETSRALAEQHDLRAVVDTLTRRAVPAIADLCAVDLLDRSGRLARVGLACRADADAGPSLGEVNLRAPRIAARVLASGRPICWPAREGCDLPTAEESVALAELGLTWLVVVPMAVGDRALGVVQLGMSASRRSLEPADLELALELAARLGLAVENARLHEETRLAVYARDVLIRGAAHDLRSPLAVIHLQCEVLQRRLAELVSASTPELERLGQLVAGVERTAARTVRQLEALLDVTRLQAGHRVSLVLGPVDLVEVVAEVVEGMRPALERAGCELGLSLPAPVVGRWDRLRLEQIASNLVGNLVKYAPGAPVSVAVSCEGAAARLVVADQGVGIAPGDLPTLFDPFARFGDTSKAPGAGLGLWIVHELAQALGGGIVVDSVLGEGTTFTVTLPLAGPADDASAA